MIECRVNLVSFIGVFVPEPYLPDRRPFDKSDPNPCSGCSNCCEYLSIGIDNPTSVKDFDHVLWYLLHKDVWVYIDDEDEWYVQFNTPCRKLDNRRCSYYEHRPSICRKYEPAACARYGEGATEKYLFKDEDDLFRYLAKKRPALFKRMKKKLNLAPDAGEQRKAGLSNCGIPG